MRVIPIAADNAGPMTGRGTNTYLLPGARPTLIDAAEDSDAYVDRVADALEAAQPGAALQQVLVTHGHHDHVAGIAALARRWPGLEVAKVPLPELDAELPVVGAALSDEQIVPAGDGTLWVVLTPGHAPDHAAFWDVRTSGVFTGDLVVNGGTVTVPASKGGHLGRYLASLRRILELQPRRLYPGHGPIVDNAAPLLRAYIGHRLGREQQVIEALAAGPSTPEEIASRIYPADLPEALREAAADNVLAHLVKLEEERKARRVGERWTSR
jgi:ribonuclease/clavin/mitogillin